MKVEKRKKAKGKVRVKADKRALGTIRLAFWLARADDDSESSHLVSRPAIEP